MRWYLLEIKFCCGPCKARDQYAVSHKTSYLMLQGVNTGSYLKGTHGGWYTFTTKTSSVNTVVHGSRPLFCDEKTNCEEVPFLISLTTARCRRCFVAVRQ